MSQIVIVEGKRTPFVRANGRFKDYHQLDLALHATNALLAEVPIAPDKISALIYGHVVLDPRLSHLAREIVLRSSLPNSIRALSVNDNCISALSAAQTGVYTLQQTDAEYVIAGGAESMSSTVLLVSERARRIFVSAHGAKTLGERVKLFAKLRPRDFLPQAPSVTEPSTGKSMGEHCEEMVKAWQISRQAQDEYAYHSHRKASRATAQGKHQPDIAPLDGLEHDDTIRPDSDLAKMATLKPAFDKAQGSITAASSSPLTDGAASILLAKETAAKRDGLTALARIKDMQFAAISPSEGLLNAPALAVPMLLQRQGLSLEDMDFIEIHEAFAGQVLCNVKAWETGWKGASVGKIDWDKVNVYGGSIALGHPFAATGARLLTATARLLKTQAKRYGLISVCGAGGTAGAFLLESIED